MSEELGNQLQKLYRDYYARRLEHGDYRYRRGLLLDSLKPGTAAATIDDATRPRPGPEPKEEETVVLHPAKPERTGGGFRWYYVLAACVVVVVGIVWVVTRQMGPPPAEPVTADSPSLPAPAPAPAAVQAAPDPAADEPIRTLDPGEALVEDFVARQDWREMSLLEFQDNWSRLAESDRIVAKGAVWFQPLSEGLAYRIEETLDFSPNPESDEELGALYGFALQLGLVELVPSGWTPNPVNINRGAPEPEVVAGTSPSRVPAEPAASAPPVSARASAPVPASPVVEAEPQPESETGLSAATSPDSPVPTEEEPATVGTASNVPDNSNACSAEQLKTRRRNCRDRLPGGDSGPLMRILPAGEFVMGGAGGVAPATVSIDAPFAISVQEILASDYRRYCRTLDTGCPEQPWPGDDMPVVGVSWQDAVDYAAWLSDQTGQTYRLPTEAEWEYAARGGTTTEFPYGDRLLPAQARYSSITVYDEPLPVSDQTTQRNEFGLWHIIGNVREWTSTAGTGTDTRVVRGGSYASTEDELRSAARELVNGGRRDRTTGIRLLREL